MELVINTAEPISNMDRSILGLLVYGEDAKQAPTATVEPKKATPEKKKAATKPEPEPTPEPMAEEPLTEEPEPEDDVLGEEQSDEDLLALAVKKATEMVAGGQAPQVREALDAAGASRVRELNKDNVREFFKALS